MTATGEQREQVARMLYEELRQCCSGYVQNVPEDESVGTGVVFDGYIAFDAFADFVIEKFGLPAIAVKDMYVQCAYPLREPALAMSDCCGKPAASAVEDPYGILYYYRCPEHEGLFRGDEKATILRHVPAAAGVKP